MISSMSQEGILNALVDRIVENYNIPGLKDALRKDLIIVINSYSKKDKTNDK